MIIQVLMLNNKIFQVSDLSEKFKTLKELKEYTDNNFPNDNSFKAHTFELTGEMANIMKLLIENFNSSKKMNLKKIYNELNTVGNNLTKILDQVLGIRDYFVPKNTLPDDILEEYDIFKTILTNINRSLLKPKADEVFAIVEKLSSKEQDNIICKLLETPFISYRLILKKLIDVFGTSTIYNEVENLTQDDCY